MNLILQEKIVVGSAVPDIDFLRKEEKSKKSPLDKSEADPVILERWDSSDLEAYEIFPASKDVIFIRSSSVNHGISQYYQNRPSDSDSDFFDFAKGMCNQGGGQGNPEQGWYIPNGSQENQEDDVAPPEQDLGDVKGISLSNYTTWHGELVYETKLGLDEHKVPKEFSGLDLTCSNIVGSSSNGNIVQLDESGKIMALEEDLNRNSDTVDLVIAMSPRLTSSPNHKMQFHASEKKSTDPNDASEMTHLSRRFGGCIFETIEPEYQNIRRDAKEESEAGMFFLNRKNKTAGNFFRITKSTSVFLKIPLLIEYESISCSVDKLYKDQESKDSFKEKSANSIYFKEDGCGFRLLSKKYSASRKKGIYHTEPRELQQASFNEQASWIKDFREMPGLLGNYITVELKPRISSDGNNPVKNSIEYREFHEEIDDFGEDSKELPDPGVHRHSPYKRTGKRRKTEDAPNFPGKGPDGMFEYEEYEFKVGFIGGGLKSQGSPDEDGLWDGNSKSFFVNGEIDGRQSSMTKPGAIKKQCFIRIKIADIIFDKGQIESITQYHVGDINVSDSIFCYSDYSDKPLSENIRQGAPKEGIPGVAPPKTNEYVQTSPIWSAYIEKDHPYNKETFLQGDPG